MNHCDIVKEKFNFEKKKIVEGINKLFALHSKIKDLYKNRHFNELKAISHQKKVITTSMNMISEKSSNLSTKSHHIDSLEKHMIEFYEGYAETSARIEENAEPLSINNSLV